jgi:hypothetical protein
VLIFILQNNDGCHCITALFDISFGQISKNEKAWKANAALCFMYWSYCRFSIVYSIGKATAIVEGFYKIVV